MQAHFQERQLRDGLDRLAVQEPQLAGSKSLPGTSPIFAIRATIGASSAVGGLVFISFARVLK